MTQRTVMAGEEDLPANVFVELARDREDVDAMLAVDLPGRPGRGPARGVLGVTWGATRAGRSGTALIEGAPIVQAVGPLDRGDPVGVSTDSTSRGFARRARPGDEIVAIALSSADGSEDGRCIRVLLGSRSYVPAEVGPGVGPTG